MENKAYAVVTGATSGIGLEFARLLANDGWNLVLVARRKLELEQIAKECTEAFAIDVRVIAADLSVKSDIEKIPDYIHEQNLQVEILVNSAGFGDYGKFIEGSWQKQEQMIMLNVLALTHLTKVFAEKFVKLGRGHIVNVASTAAFQPGPLMAVYYATKSYVLHFSEAIATELRPTGVKVTALCPGPTASKFQEAAQMTRSKLVQGKKLPTASQVAVYGYKAMRRGKVVAIHGASNKIGTYAVRFLPRRTVRALVHRAQSSK